jgi:hypothetical protein
MNRPSAFVAGFAAVLRYTRPFQSRDICIRWEISGLRVLSTGGNAETGIPGLSVRNRLVWRLREPFFLPGPDSFSASSSAFRNVVRLKMLAGSDAEWDGLVSCMAKTPLPVHPGKYAAIRRHFRCREELVP